MPINPEDPRPLPLQIAGDLRERIEKGEFASDDRFPSLKKLAQEYGVAELTIHAAVRELQRDGLLVSIAGRGTYVRKGAATGAPEGDVLEELRSIRDELKELRERVAAHETATPLEERMQELTRRVAALEGADEQSAR